MPIALEVRGLSKRFTVGFGGCVATAHVLRGVDLSIHGGESVAVVGAPGSGKSTLLLCLAGLMSADRGEIRWFGESDRGAAVRRAVYHSARADLMRSGSIDERHVHLVDLDDAATHAPQIERWIATRIGEGDAVLFTSSSDELGARCGSRVLVLDHGTLQTQTRARTRVAERAR